MKYNTAKLNIFKRDTPRVNERRHIVSQMSLSQDNIINTDSLYEDTKILTNAIINQFYATISQSKFE